MRGVGDGGKETVVRSPLRPHERLDAWQRSIDLVIEVYQATDQFPRNEQFGLVSQMRRAAASIPANLAEGCARRGNDEQRQFFYVARGSLSELETFLVVASRLGFGDQSQIRGLMAGCGRVGALVNGLIKRRERPAAK
jgi:four helix bundle protein